MKDMAYGRMGKKSQIPERCINKKTKKKTRKDWKLLQKKS